MAKLTDVKVINMVSGEKKTIEHDGKTYEYVGEGDYGKKGDIVEVIKPWGSQVAGSFYKVINLEDHKMSSLIRMFADNTDEIVYIDGETEDAATDNLEDVRIYRTSTPDKGVKKGDIIRITNEFVSEGFYRNGDILTVKSVDSDGDVYVEESGVVILKEEFEVVGKEAEADAENKPKFIVFSQAPSWASVTKGKEYEINRNHPDGYVITDDDGDTQFVLSENSAFAYEIISVDVDEHSEAKPSDKYNGISVGDEVEVIESPSAKPVGSVFKVAKLSEIPLGQPAVVDDEGFIYHPEKHVKLVDKGSKSREIAEGDIVVITANTNASRNKVGDIGKVGKVYPGSRGACVDVPGRPRYVDGELQNENFTLYTEMRLANEEERIRYEVSNFSEGDIVKATLHTGEVVVGEVEDLGITAIGLRLLTKDADSDRRRYEGVFIRKGETAEIIVKASDRLDKK